MATKPKEPKHEYWSKETPSVDGWYWMKYKNAEGRYIECPAYVSIMRGPGMTANHVRSARNDSFIEGPSHGGWGLKYHGKLDKSIRFGARITEPPA